MTTDHKEDSVTPDLEGDQYDGPWIDKRIEWKCPDRKRHNVVLFGSWNRFAGGDELEYQGKQVFACIVKLPLGNYVYRFLVDGEEWETHNTAKTARNGIEYNQIHVTEGDSDEEEEDDYDNNGDDADDETSNNTTLVFEGGQLTIGAKKKRRGRPSMELDLGVNFAEGDEDMEDVEPLLEGDDEEDTPVVNGDDDDNDNGKSLMSSSNSGTTTTTTAAAGDDDDVDNKKKHSSSRRKRRKRKKKKKGEQKMEEKEWARYVFVQQLRQQQAHNDEIGRVKTLWKQERQVRVEMHKKVVKQLKQLKKDHSCAQVEIARLEKQAMIGRESDDREGVILKVQNEKLEAKVMAIAEQLKLKDLEFTNHRKERVVADKLNRESKGDWDSQQRKYRLEISNMKAQLKTVSATNDSLQLNVDALRNTNNKSLQLKTAQLEERGRQWNDEKADMNRKLVKMKEMKENVNQLENELQVSKDALSQSAIQLSLAKENEDSLEKSVGKLEEQLNEMKNSTEAAEMIQHKVAQAKSEFEADNHVLQEKMIVLEKQMNEQQMRNSKEMLELNEKHRLETEALQNNSEIKMNALVDELRKDIQNRDSTLNSLRDVNNSLQSNFAANEVLSQEQSKKYELLHSEHENSKQMNIELQEQMNGIQTQLEIEQKSKISSEHASHALIQEKKERLIDLETRLHQSQESVGNKEEEINNLQMSVQSLNMTLNEKSELSANLSAEMDAITANVNQLKISENALNEKVLALQNSLNEEQENSEKSRDEFEEQLNKLNEEMNKVMSEKDKQMIELGVELKNIENELNAKLQEFNHAETTIQELNANIEAEQLKFENERMHFENSAALFQEKEDRIHNACKTLFQKFTGIRDEMKSIKETQIQQLEELHKFFSDFGPLLGKVFAFNQSMIDDLLTKYKRELSLRRKYFNLVQDLRGNIRVFCRVRPLLKFEIAKKYGTCMKFPQEGSIVVKTANGQNKYEFDQVYVPDTSQEQVSEDATEYIQSVMDGYNVSIFAYGQTGSGKTYTMEGPIENPGVNIRALSHLFKLAEQRAPQFQYKIKVSIFEVYNDNIMDLIETVNPSYNPKNKNKKKKYRIRHMPDDSVIVEGLTWVSVKSDADVLRLNKIAKSFRKQASTAMNKESSRSHMLLVVDVQGINIPANIKYFGKLYLVDLAGSERVKKSGASGQALKEAAAINKSLSALGDVMNALQSKAKFVPYRNSTLTDLMRNALGGNAKTIMFINCCPTDEHVFETTSSLNFATRVGKVELGQAKKNTKKNVK